MKSERRHELKQNTLAHGLETLPEVGRRHGTKILLVVMVGLAVALLIRNRVSSSRRSADQAAFHLSHGRELIDQLVTAAERVPPSQFASVAQQISKGVDTAVQQVLETTDDPRMVAEARLVQGDLNWQLASMPEPPGATTRPELALPRTDEQFLQSAADAYQAAIEERSAPHESITTARLGLAAVAENRAQWDQARDHYQKVLDDAATPKPLKDMAAASITRLETLRKPPLLAPPATGPAPFSFDSLRTPGTQPSSAPATTQGTQPASATSPPAVTAPSVQGADAKPQAAPSAPGALAPGASVSPSEPAAPQTPG